MTTLSDLDSLAREFFAAMHSATEGDTEAQISMYTVGEIIGLDREASSEAAEDLMALGLVEVRTLAGAIGLSQQGADLMAGGSDTKGDAAQRLGTESPMNAFQCELVENVLNDLKHDLGGRGLAYETIAEVIAHVRTIEAQMTSPKPKTTIVRECLAALAEIATDNRQKEWQGLLNDILG